ncbi:response regulator receiver protein [Methanoregula boonei 6A8]|jgi:CheY-like chemotaxis protein|uniref:Response regulator receiver protein n=1 Tax=Methanoregula boonei (strain DSM 21154 / JCM 14090 / 6A8) TaxID=456442 RepID=A7I9B6_METB6|nr:response regulator [Methanoregula boonei]ABS56327.1 response regulator receiver protein [Methanoregula boonei 6A8]
MAESQGDPPVILLVEDNEAHAELVMRSFRELDIENVIFHVSDGQQALDFLHNKGGFAKTAETNPRPHLVLLDLRLPKVDGLDVLREIKKTPGLQRIPVVILTSSDAENDILRSYDSGANSYVVKPTEFRKFTRVMESLGHYWLGWNVPSCAGE